MWNIKEVGNMDGKRVLITGGSSGLGLETVKFLYSKNAEIIVATRNLKNAKKILQEENLKKISLMELDLSSIESIKKFSKEFKMKYNSLSYLINNAGIMMTDELKTKDGYELQFGTNHLGHFLLTKEMLELLKKSENARVITLSSLAHNWGKKKLNYENINLLGEYNKTNAYCQSKLANLMFALELNEKFKKNNLDIKSIACHPGFSRTNLQRELNIVLKFITGMISQNSEDGVLPSIRAITDMELSGGEYLGPNGFGERKGKKVGKSKISIVATNKDERKKLWELSEKMLGEKFEI